VNFCILPQLVEVQQELFELGIGSVFCRISHWCFPWKENLWFLFYQKLF
jgi:hypothetical protein